MARAYWGQQNPVGQRLRFGGPAWRTVIGVVGDVRHEGLDGESKPEMYVRFAQTPQPETVSTIVVRTEIDAAAMTMTLRKAVSAIDTALPLDQVRTMEQLVSSSVGQPRFRTVLLAVFSMLALVMATIGIYGVRVMTASGFRPFACLLLAITAVRPQPSASPVQREPLRMLKEFRRHALGLMDIFADGRLLLMHERLREKSRSSDARLHRLRVIDEPSGREIAALKFETAEPRTMLVLPSSHEVLVSGTPIEPAAGRGYRLWDPHTGKFRALGALDPASFTFIQFLDAVRILGQRSSFYTTSEFTRQWQLPGQ